MNQSLAGAKHLQGIFVCVGFFAHLPLYPPTLHVTQAHYRKTPIRSRASRRA